jgi:hypothetical protein
MEAISMQNSNPLVSHFRQPAVFLKLPSEGKYWIPGTIDIPANGEIGVMPMTARDEVTLRTPDALMNGQGVVSVIESCCPEIKNAWAMPTIDADAILIAIRIATYGDTMEMQSGCPKCNHETNHGLGLGDVLMRVRAPDYGQPLIVDGLAFKFRPLNYQQSNKNDIARFEEQRIIQLIDDQNLDDQAKATQFDMHLKKLVDSSIALLALSTESITTQAGEVVTDANFINEFYNNCSNSTIKAIQVRMNEYKKIAELPAARVSCEECNHQYNVNVQFDYANFFEPLS